MAVNIVNLPSVTFIIQNTAHTINVKDVVASCLAGEHLFYLKGVPFGGGSEKNVDDRGPQNSRANILQHFMVHL